MKETQASEGKESEAEKLPAPGGIGMAVAVDWGLVVQIALTPIASIIFSQPNPLKIPGTIGIILFFVLALLAAALCAYFGEMIRSGRLLALRIQIVFSALLSLGGVLGLIGLYQSVRAGNFWPVVTEVILVIVSPLTVWRMSRPATILWFKNVTAAQARQRHGGKWVWFIILSAIVGGVLQTLAAMKR